MVYKRRSRTKFAKVHPGGRAGKLKNELPSRAATILAKGYKQLETRPTLLTLPLSA